LLVLGGLVAQPAAADFVGINATFDPLIPIGDPVITPPLSNSSSLSVPISMAFTAAHSNWAGVGFTLTYDPTEVNFTGLTPRASYLKTNTPSAAPVSLPTLWHSQAPASGIFVSTGFNPQIADIGIHATGTTTANNGDTDVRVSLPTFAFNIFHVTETGPLTLAPGEFVYVLPGQPVSGTERGVGPVVGPPLTALPAVPVGGGVWVKLNNPEVPVALASAFWGRAVTPVGNVHIEHAGGEPILPALTTWGLTALLAGIVLTGVYAVRRRPARRLA
jgi:hypothetical protein